MTGAPVRTREFRADVQGLRAIAVGLVLLYHARVPGITGGYIGVDVFFVISGFLISSHLLEAIERDGRIGFARFYARRARRILPASFVVAALTAIAVVVFLPPLSVARALRDGVATVLYVPNIWFAIQDTDYLADHSPSPYQHYWSLGVEEQFYLLWPAVLLLIVLIVRRRRALVIVTIALVAIASFVSCVVLTQSQQPLAFFLLHTRAWELLAGALVGAAVLGRTPRIPPTLAAIGGWAGVVAILLGAVVFDDATTFPGTAAALPVVGTAAVIWFGTAPSRFGPAAALSLRPMQFIGLISYSLYLVHWPLLVIPQAAMGDDERLPFWARAMLGIVIAIPLAYLLYRWVEEPARGARTLTGRRPRVTLLGAGGISVVLALALTAGAVWADAQKLSGGDAVAPAESGPTSPPTSPDHVPANLTPALEEADVDVPSVYDDGCHHNTVTTEVQDCEYGIPGGLFRIALFGDSHSAQWLPALEELAEDDGELSIRTYTKSSCPAVDVTVLVRNVAYASCDTWRDAVIAHLAEDPPDLVVISNYSAYPLDGVSDPDARRAEWADGTGRMVQTLREIGSDVLLIADTPRFDVAPPTCLSAHLTEVSACAGVRDIVLDEAQTTAEREAAETAEGRYADYTDYVCDDVSCPAIIDNLLVYRDVNHLTTTFVRHLSPLLGEALRPEG